MAGWVRLPRCGSGARPGRSRPPRDDGTRPGRQRPPRDDGVRPGHQSPPRGDGARPGCQTSRPALRVLRAGVFATVCVLLSAGLHTLTAGDAVDLLTLSAAMAATWSGALALTGRRRGRGTLLIACFAAQYGMHHLFTASFAVSHLAAPDPGAGLQAHHLLGQHAHLTPVLLGQHAHLTPVAMAAGHQEHGSGLGMALVHVAVALISGWWLERGDAALAELTRLAVASAHGLVAWLLAPPAAPVAVARPGLTAARTAPALPSSPLLAATITRRGPPVSLPAR
ncbi:hypothetical protein HTZ77_33685 [Nonomuraea sp. SMC257]|uniref:Uncharacterized protein n=1 Tax=Nonomuraea montanisoli TaxID=2741721 RepID=A0A7Y6IGC5_9ACTN|nr:hypothetical protein [Nonomuraea montanisoli]NUW36324.1 hypothetical protein [Nonomuraea montanisoli]